jgi:hypothetical protein
VKEECRESLRSRTRGYGKRDGGGGWLESCEGLQGWGCEAKEPFEHFGYRILDEGYQKSIFEAVGGN